MDAAQTSADAEIVVVVGQGYVGLPLAVRAAEAGFTVIGVEPHAERLAALRRGESYVPDVARDRLRAVIEGGRYSSAGAVPSAPPFDVAVVTVPTPLSDGRPDLSHIDAAGRAVSEVLTPGATVILESTTWPGTTEEFLRPILEAGSGLRAGIDFSLGYSPERIDPGNRRWSFETTPKVVSGMTASCLDAVDSFYRQLVERTVPLTKCSEAELCKLLENTFRHVNIALVNEMAMFASDLDVDVWQVIDAADTKPFGFMRFDPGPGVGGHCLPVDPSYLLWRIKQRLGAPFRFIELANDINDHMPDYVVRRFTSAMNERELSVKGRRILVLGLAYKKNTGDAREAPSTPICEKLVALGASVNAVDPHVHPSQVPDSVGFVELSAEQIRRADAVIVVVDHDDFDAELVRRHARYVLDTRNWLGRSDNVEVL